MLADTRTGAVKARGVHWRGRPIAIAQGDKSRLTKRHKSKERPSFNSFLKFSHSELTKNEVFLMVETPLREGAHNRFEALSLHRERILNS